MAHRSFTSPTGGDDVTFDLNGVTYHCRPRLPAGVTLDVATVGGTQPGVGAAQRVGEFFDAALMPDDAALFAAALRDPEVVVPMETLQEIIQYLVEVYTGRPTGQQAGSGNGLSPTGPPSTAAVSPRE